MSWSETKLLMDGHDEILEKIDSTVDPIKRYSYSYVNTTTGTFLEVTGKGRFYYGKIDGSSIKTPGATINIFVDGKQIVSGNFNGVSGSGSGINVLLPIANYECYQISYASNTVESYYPFSGASISIRGLVNGMHPLTADSSYTYSVTGSTSGGSDEYWFYIDRYIEFKESFKVELTDNNASKIFTAYLCYSLDEE